MNTNVNSPDHSAPSPDPQHQRFRVGAAQIDITPTGSVFLYGYPHVKRMSTGIHDPLLASAIWIEANNSACLMIGCDLIFLPRHVTDRVRQQLSDQLGLPVSAIMLSVTHTHSGPKTNHMISNNRDSAVPPVDNDYLEELVKKLIEVGNQARQRVRDARLTATRISSDGLGGNRRDPKGPRLEHWPVLIARDAADDEPLAVMAIVAMHPTVLHEDSTVISGDFPGLARLAIQQQWGDQVVFLHHMGAAGNQSPRHAVDANTLEQTKRLGDMLASRIMEAASTAEAISPARVSSAVVEVELPRRQLPDVEQATRLRDQAKQRLSDLKNENAPRATVRTAEVDWFGAEETLTLAQAKADGQFDKAADQCMPAQVQLIQVGDLRIIGWPGEVFVEFAQQLMAQCPHAHVVTLANGGLQGYLVTQQAVDERAYEAGNAVFASPQSGQLLVEASVRLIQKQ